ncbi:MAG: alpha-L-fucosidase [Verrucomicrobiae bacterium]|nr:alpha-L-fucosidase [Verrucomicrobiae bacterium]
MKMTFHPLHHGLRPARNAALALALLAPILARGADARLRLPESDILWQAVKDYVEAEPVAGYRHAPEASREAFRDIKYGVRIHWGLYSLKEWKESWNFLTASNEERQAYQELYKSWNPAGFDADEWMRLFKENGVQMFAFTANHLDGFSMFDTKTRVRHRVNWTAPGGPRIEPCDLAYSIMETPFKRDVVRELTDAGRKHGLKIDLYFSHPQWYDADFRPYCYHPMQTPGSRDHPELYANTFQSKQCKNATMSPDPTPDEEAHLIQRHRRQLTELLTNYGKIDMVCLDMWLGKKIWPQTRETLLALRKLQPDVMFRARGIGNYGDYYTPEGFVPGSKENTDMPWFVIYPLGTGFSYRGPSDRFKGGPWIVTSIVDAVAKGGNFMVGIGPDANGKFPPEVVGRLQEAGAWLKVNGEAIFKTRPRDGALWKEGDSIRFTRAKDNGTVYAIALKWPGETFTVATVAPKEGSSIELLGHRAPLKWSYAAATGLTIELPAALQDEAARPCRTAWAFKIPVAPPTK